MGFIKDICSSAVTGAVLGGAAGFAVAKSLMNSGDESQLNTKRMLHFSGMGAACGAALGSAYVVAKKIGCVAIGAIIGGALCYYARIPLCEFVVEKLGSNQGLEQCSQIVTAIGAVFGGILACF